MTKHIVFGSALLAMRYSQQMAVNPDNIILATRPDLLLESSKQSLVVVRYPSEIWKPATFPCEKRVKEMEDYIKRIQSSGIEVKTIQR